MARIRQWEMRAANQPFAAAEREVGPPGPGEVLVRVAACGVCHTDFGFWAGEVKTNHALPLVLGHEISGVVEEAGPGAERWRGQPVVVPAVLPCGECDACRRGRYALCPRQIFPGNDIDGGFATHVVVPARHLCSAVGLEDRLPLLSVVADALSTPYEAIVRSGLRAGDLAIFVGVGGVGGFGVQIAAALGATVVAVDPAAARRELALRHGAALALDPVALDVPALRKAVRGFVKERGLPAEEWKLFETSGTTRGQETAFALLGKGAHLGVVGFTPQSTPLMLSKLMALDARAVGNWGCAPERYPEILDLVRAGKIALEPFVEIHPLSEINQVFQAMAEHKLERRAVLVPEGNTGGTR